MMMMVVIMPDEDLSLIHYLIRGIKRMLAPSPGTVPFPFDNARGRGPF